MDRKPTLFWLDEKKELPGSPTPASENRSYIDGELLILLAILFLVCFAAFYRACL